MIAALLVLPVLAVIAWAAWEIRRLRHEIERGGIETWRR